MKPIISLALAILCGVLPVLAQNQDTDDLFEQGVTAYWGSRNTEQEAVDIFSQVIEQQPTNANAYAYRGASYRVLNEMSLAKIDFDKALALDPENGLALSMLSRWHMQRGEVEPALEASEQALTFAPDIAVVHYNHGRIFLDLSNYQNAIRYYDKAIELEKNPVSLSQYYRSRGLARILLNGDRLTAIQDFSLAIETNPENPDPYADRAHNYILFGYVGEAIPDLERALELDPEFVYAMERYGDALSQLGRYDEALDILEHAAEIEPDRANVFLGQGLTYYRMGQKAAALEKLNEAAALDASNSDIVYNRAIVRNELGDVAGALEDYDIAIQLNPRSHQALMNRGSLYRDTYNDYASAIADYDAAIALWPDFVMAINNRGIAYSRDGDHGRSLEDFLTVIQLTPLWNVGYYNAGLEYYALERYEEAVEAYTRSIELDPYHVESYQSRALAYQRLGDRANAEADFDKVDDLGGCC